jgi:CBS domain-containing protein
MSPRAAWRFERFGFDDVHDYAAGKVDWIAAGLPTIRSDPGPRRAIDAADRNPLTCRPDTRVVALEARSAVVVNDTGVVLGRVRGGQDGDEALVAEAIMEPGPTTVRAHEPLDELLARMARRRVHEVIVTTPEGVLLGVVRAPA